MNGRAGPKAGPDAASPTVAIPPNPVQPDLDAERASRSANLAWVLLADRHPARSNIERLRRLQAAGLVMDETNPVFHHWAES